MSRPSERAAALNLSMTPTEWALLGLLSLLWGSSFFFIRVSVLELPPLVVVLLRVGLAALVLNLLLALRGKTLPRSATLWRAFLVMGLINNALPFTLIVWGEAHIGSGLAAILNATTPMFTAAVAHAFTRDEKLTHGRVTGILIGLAGVAVMIGPSAFAPGHGVLLAQLAILGAATSYAFGTVFGRRFRTLGLSPLVAAAGQVTASSLILLPLTFAIDHPLALPMPSWPAIGAVFGLGVLSTALAFILYFRILATAGATNVSLVTLLVPVTAILLGTSLLGEHLGRVQILGMGLILLGLVVIDGRLLRHLTRWR